MDKYNKHALEELLSMVGSDPKFVASTVMVTIAKLKAPFKAEYSLFNAIYNDDLAAAIDSCDRLVSLPSVKLSRRDEYSVSCTLKANNFRGEVVTWGSSGSTYSQVVVSALLQAMEEMECPQ